MRTLLVILFMSITQVYGQDFRTMLPTETNAVQGVNIYIEGLSGTLVKNTTGLFTGNEIEVGLQYYKSFEKAPWFKMLIQGAVLSAFGANNINLNAGKPDAAINPNFQYNGRGDATIGIKDVELGFYFSHYYYVGITHNFLIKNYMTVPVMLAKDNMFTIFSEIDIQPFYIGDIKNSADPNLEAEGTQVKPYLDLFSIGVRYQVTFAKNWSFDTSVALRSSGHSATISGSTLPNVWETDSLDAFIANLNIRWDSSFQYTMDNGFYVWSGIRYTAERLIPNPLLVEAQDAIGRTLHDVHFRMGLGYRFAI